MKFWFSMMFTLFAVVLCAINYAGYDPYSLYLYFFSIPVWIIDAFSDIHIVHPFLVYLLTIVSWFLLGLFADWFAFKIKAR